MYVIFENFTVGLLLSIFERHFCEICFIFTERVVFPLWNRCSRKINGECRAVRQCGGCGDCYKLEARPIETNRQLWDFDIRSKDIKWHNIITPLVPRGNPVYLGNLFPYLSSGRDELSGNKRREVLVCHDMMGNYLEDRFFNSSVKYDDYRFFHWSGVDYFCYFSHKYVTIPPCGWINAAHSHGVKVLGTFITESSPPLQEVLRSKQSIDSTVSALVRLCKHFCFEGWLLNIECKVDKHLMENLYYFVKELREQIRNQVENGTVFWYDSVIQTGQLSWQNEINEQNIRFFKLSDATLINYTWNDKSLENTSNILQTQSESATKSFFGIDIFGRGQVAKFKSKQTLAKLSKTDFSIGFFAPGWTFETLQQFGYDVRRPGGQDDVNNAFLLRNDKFWWSLWEYLPTHLYVHLPLYTDFCVGSGKSVFMSGHKISNTGQFFNLSKQSLQPSVPLYNCVERNFDNAFNGGSSLKVSLSDTSFRVFATDYHIDGTLVFAYAFKLNQDDGDLDYIIRLQSDGLSGECLVFLGDYYHPKVTPGRCYLSAIRENHIEALKMRLEDSVVQVKIPFTVDSDWRIRYYVLNFDTTVQVKDIGVFFRKRAQVNDAAYLGAVYLNNIESITMPEESNAAYLKIIDDSLLK